MKITMSKDNKLAVIDGKNYERVNRPLAGPGFPCAVMELRRHYLFELHDGNTHRQIYETVCDVPCSYDCCWKEIPE